MQTSNYWIVKGNKLNPDRDGDIVQQMNDYIDGIDRRENWWSQLRKRIHPDFRPGHYVLAWRARRKIGIVGFGRVRFVKPYYAEEQRFEWEPLEVFPEDNFIGIRDIEATFKAFFPPDEQKPDFIRSSIIQTVYAVSPAQARFLKEMMKERKLPLPKNRAGTPKPELPRPHS